MLQVVEYLSDEAEAEGLNQSDLQSFLLQSPDEEDVGHVELAEFQIPSEAEVMAQFHRSQISSSSQSPDTSQRYSATFFQTTPNSSHTVQIKIFLM